MKPVEVIFRGERATCVQWEPLLSGICDAVIRFPDGRRVAVASHELKWEGKPVFPPRRELFRAAREKALRDIEAIRSNHAQDKTLWAGKDIIGRALDGAAEELKERLDE